MAGRMLGFGSLARETPGGDAGVIGVAILYPGNLGCALGAGVAKAGGIPITCVMGRTDATRTRAIETGFTIMPSLRQLSQKADVLVSLVPPRFAIETARTLVTSLEHARDVRIRAYIDGNSVCPEVKRKVAHIVREAGLSCLDGAFFGPAGRVGPDNLLALSGPQAEQIAPFLRQVVEVRVMGPQIGRASAIKMAVGILTKALCALFVEMICASAKEGGLDAVLDVMWRFYPGTMHFLERSLPTYPQHVARKADELEQVIDWLGELRVRADMTHGAKRVLRRLQDAGFERSGNWGFADLVRNIVDRDLLTIPPAICSKECARREAFH